MVMERKITSARGNGNFKGLEVGVSLACWSNSKEATVPGRK